MGVLFIAPITQLIGIGIPLVGCLTYVKWIEGCVIKPWEMAVSQGFLYIRDSGEIS